MSALRPRWNKVRIDLAGSPTEPLFAWVENTDLSWANYKDADGETVLTVNYAGSVDFPPWEAKEWVIAHSLTPGAYLHDIEPVGNVPIWCNETEKPEKAMRFCRKADAEKIARLIDGRQHPWKAIPL